MDITLRSATTNATTTATTTTTTAATIATTPNNNNNDSKKKVHSHQQDALPWHPAYWQHCPALDAIVVTAVQISAHAKVGYLDGEVFAYQAITRGQVPVYKVQRGEVLHPWGYLSRHVAQVAVAVGGRSSVKTAADQSSVCRDVAPLLPDSGGVAEQGELPLRLVAGQELVEVAVLHVLCYHAEGVAVDAHGQKADDVGIL